MRKFKRNIKNLESYLHHKLKWCRVSGFNEEFYDSIDETYYNAERIDIYKCLKCNKEIEIFNSNNRKRGQNQLFYVYRWAENDLEVRYKCEQIIIKGIIE